VYGALAGHLGAVLPACASWEDATWALGRCWLEATLDRRLAQVAPAFVPAALHSVQQLMFGNGGTDDRAATAQQHVPSALPMTCPSCCPSNAHV
jgi:Nuclear pore protein 84 / 107